MKNQLDNTQIQYETEDAKESKDIISHLLEEHGIKGISKPKMVCERKVRKAIHEWCSHWERVSRMGNIKYTDGSMEKDLLKEVFVYD